MARANGKDRGLFQKNGVWWVRWTCCYGHEHREKGGSKSLARQLYERRKTAARHEGFCLDEARQRQKREELQSFQVVSARYLEWVKEHRPRSERFYVSVMKQLARSFGQRSMNSITAQDVERHQKRRQKEGVVPATINRDRAVLSHLFTMAIKWGLAERNPVKDTEKLNEDNVNPRPLSEDEERRLFNVLPIHYKPFVTFALNTGLRLGELQTQRWADVNMEDGTLTVTRPKSGKYEIIPLNTVAHAVLAELDRSDELVFPRMPRRMSDLFIKYARQAGLDDISFHDLRDTFVSRLAVGANPATIMALARHRDFRTTQRYLKFDDNHLRLAVESIVRAKNDDLIGTITGTDV